MSSNSYKYGEVIRQHRILLGLTQRQVADLCEITDSAFAHIEREIRLPSESVAGRIAKALRLTGKVRAEFDAGLKEARKRQTRERVQNRAKFKPILGSSAPDAQDVARDLDENPDLREAYRYLKKALGKRSQRVAVIRALKAWASET